MLEHQKARETPGRGQEFYDHLPCVLDAIAHVTRTLTREAGRSSPAFVAWWGSEQNTADQEVLSFYRDQALKELQHGQFRMVQQDGSWWSGAITVGVGRSEHKLHGGEVIQADPGTVARWYFPDDADPRAGYGGQVAVVALERRLEQLENHIIPEAERLLSVPS